MLDKPFSVLVAKILATFFGLGYAPFAPGTFGALGGLAVSCALVVLGEVGVHYIHAALIVGAYMAGVWACQTLADEWGQDPSKVVIDEALGFWVSIIGLPLTPFYFIGGLLLFRVFDIAKPFGIRRIDRWHTPHAVMLDDVAAGVAANILLQIVRYAGYGA